MKWIFGFRNVKIEEPGKENELCPVCGLPLNSCICEDEPVNPPVEYCETCGKPLNECAGHSSDESYVKIKFTNFKIPDIGSHVDLSDEELYELFDTNDIIPEDVEIKQNVILDGNYKLVETSDDSDEFILTGKTTISLYVYDNLGEGKLLTKDTDAYFKLLFKYNEDEYYEEDGYTSHCWELFYATSANNNGNLPSLDGADSIQFRIDNGDKYDVVGLKEIYSDSNVEIISKNF